MPLDELMLELEKLKKRLPAEDFHRVMRMLAASGKYSPEEKAASFNKMMPVDNETFPVYGDTLRDWGLEPDARDDYFRFAMIRENLAISYALAKCRTKEALADLLLESSDLSEPSFIGEGVQRRTASMKSVIDSMVASKDIAREDAVALIRDLDMDEDFKNGLLYRLGERKSPYR
jgi:hypothetical protein